MVGLEDIVVKVDMEQCRPILEKLFARIEQLSKENEELKDTLDKTSADLDITQERITDLEGLPLHS